MYASPRAIGLVSDHLIRHRTVPPEHDGWFSLYEIEMGIKQEQEVSIRSRHVAAALNFLLEAQPPAIEETWMLDDADHNPVLGTQYAHPNQPLLARRFYRALANAAEYAVVE